MEATFHGIMPFNNVMSQEVIRIFFPTVLDFRNNKVFMTFSSTRWKKLSINDVYLRLSFLLRGLPARSAGVLVLVKKKGLKKAPVWKGRKIKWKRSQKWRKQNHSLFDGAVFISSFGWSLTWWQHASLFPLRSFILFFCHFQRRV